MTVLKNVAQWMTPILNWSAVRRTRRNHALEHATIHLLNRQKFILSGRSDANGFIIIGEVPTTKVETAAKEALRRLRDGEHSLAIHPNCGTNLVTTGLLTTTIAALGFSGINRRRAWDRFPLMMALVMGTLLYSQPLGMTLQRYFTTEGDPGDMEYVGIVRRESNVPLAGKVVVHQISTRGG
jgi:hypothetical protein